MTTFVEFNKAIQKQIKSMEATGLYVVDLDKDLVWNTYLDSFPEGTNEIYITNREHDCNCCKQFIRDIGRVVTIVNNTMVSIWDVDVGGEYGVVAKALSELVKSAKIKRIFRHFTSKIGTQKSIAMGRDAVTVQWDHFHTTISSEYVLPKTAIGQRVGAVDAQKHVLKRSLDEITDDAVDSVIELISQGSLYRGAEFSKTVKDFKKVKTQYKKIKSEEEKDMFVWDAVRKLGGLSGIRNTVIGTLLVDLSDGVDLEGAVGSYEAKVAPTNYKRPTALVTPRMITEAHNKILKLGYGTSLQRRDATMDDISINNVIFADRSVREQMDVFGEMMKEVKTTPKNLKKVEEIGIQKFLEDVVPNATSVEMLVENHHMNSFMRLIAPKDMDAPNILKWGNNFSWAYKGDVTDSIKERVKKAGGKVDGILRVSLSWFNIDDLDIHVIEPNKNEIYFGNKRSSTSGHLDVDMNVTNAVRNAVENVIWTDGKKIKEGDYHVAVRNFTKRETVDVGFEIEIECGDQKLNFVYDKPVKSSEVVKVVKFNYTKKDGIRIIEGIKSGSVNITDWNITSNTYHKVNMIMNSPNHWDGECTGNKHVFFILDGCHSDESARGLYNEFLDEKLTPHRKVFEVLGNKLTVPASENQLSGIGFSETKRNFAFFKVSGNINRVVKVLF